MNALALNNALEANHLLKDLVRTFYELGSRAQTRMILEVAAERELYELYNLLNQYHEAQGGLEDLNLYIEAELDSRV